MSRKFPLSRLLVVCGTLVLILLLWSSFLSSLRAKLDVMTIQVAINDYREQLREELKDFNFYREDYIPEIGGNQQRYLVVTTWRSGSSFFGELISSIPGVLYEYEPLTDFGRVKIRESNKTRAIQRLYKLFYCDYYGMDEYFEVAKELQWPFKASKRIWSLCEVYSNICFNKDFLARFCRLFPFRLIKVVRLGLNLVEELLANEKLNLKVVFLVRDPRGTLQSRRHAKWCVDSPDCGIPSRLCDELETDYHAAVRLTKIYPSSFRVVRYEDLALDPVGQTEKIVSFLQLYMHPKILEFLDTHTKELTGDAYSTYRDSQQTPFHWRKDFNRSDIKRIETQCSTAMKLWGYKKIEDESMTDKNLLGNYSL